MHHGPGGRPGAWATGALIGLIALAILAAAAVGEMSGNRRIFGLGVGAFLLAAAWLVISAGALRRAPGWVPTSLDGRPAWALPIRGSAAAATLLTILSLGLGVGAAADGRLGPIVVFGLVAVFLGVLAVELWRVLWRRCELRVSADVVELHGPGIEARVAWDDVSVVDYVHLGTRWAAVHVGAVPGASSYRAELRRLLLPTDRTPEPPGVALRVGQVSDAPRLMKLLRAMHVADRAGREAMISRGLPEQSGF